MMNVEHLKCKKTKKYNVRNTMETSSILSISISVQTFQYAPKALYIYVLFT